LPGCLTQGKTVEECIERAKEAIAGRIASAEAHDEPIPEETMRPQVIHIDVAA
jgi:predicted RNase H-like HicB family nuclease